MEDLKSIWPQWQIVELIGQGAYGKVYKIKREEMGQTSYAALKIIELPQDKAEVRELMNSGMDYQSVQYYYEDMVKNLQNEIRVMETLKSGNNIVSIEDYAFDKREEGIGWIIYIRMELLTNLNSYLEKEGRELSKEEVIKLGTDICLALSCCEQSHVIHRDIKPDNVFLNRYGDYKLGDFGIAKQMEQTKSAYSQKGTSMYMAPEVSRGERYDRTVDIYSLGIMLYKLLNHGRFPFMPPYPERLRPYDAEEAMRKRMNGETMPLPVGAPGELGRVILKACAYEPELRYQDAQSFREALSACLRDGSAKQKNAETVREEKSASEEAGPQKENGKSEYAESLKKKTVGDLEKTYGAWNTGPQKKQTSAGSMEKEPQVSYSMKQDQIKQDKIKVENKKQESWQGAKQSEPKQTQFKQTEGSNPAFGKSKKSSSGFQKFSKVVVAFMFIGVVLSVVFNSTDKEDQKTSGKENSIAADLNEKIDAMNLDTIVVPYLLGETWQDCSFQVNDQVITLPCTISEIEEKGFYLDKKYADTMVKAGEGTEPDLELKDENDNILRISAVNQGGSESPVSNCTVNYIFISNSSVDEGGLIVNFPGHIKIGDSLESVVEKYGEAGQIADGSDEHNGVYTWFTEDNKAVLSINFTEGKLENYALSVY